ncbi:hypothetical protein FF38_12836 [Lucilia cuprina]|uniref:Uncharacterized protein n=1 Tax=Lucilia cuprina TaxID=7375 RepID=A0A0L0CJ55_LUCCU|nr:hypothetical protein FF38_12836 [Lucilia cuprina]
MGADKVSNWHKLPNNEDELKVTPSSAMILQSTISLSVIDDDDDVAAPTPIISKFFCSKLHSLPIVSRLYCLKHLHSLFNIVVYEGFVNIKDDDNEEDGDVVEHDCVFVSVVVVVGEGECVLVLMIFEFLLSDYHTPPPRLHSHYYSLLHCLAGHHKTAPVVVIVVDFYDHVLFTNEVDRDDDDDNDVEEVVADDEGLTSLRCSFCCCCCLVLLLEAYCSFVVVGFIVVVVSKAGIS